MFLLIDGSRRSGCIYRCGISLAPLCSRIGFVVDFECLRHEFLLLNQVAILHLQTIQRQCQLRAQFLQKWKISFDKYRDQVLAATKFRRKEIPKKNVRLLMLFFLTLMFLPRLFSPRFRISLIILTSKLQFLHGKFILLPSFSLLEYSTWKWYCIHDNLFTRLFRKNEIKFTKFSLELHSKLDGS